MEDFEEYWSQISDEVLNNDKDAAAIKSDRNNKVRIDNFFSNVHSNL